MKIAETLRFLKEPEWADWGFFFFLILEKSQPTATNFGKKKKN
jgi:hypothetical protein